MDGWMGGWMDGWMDGLIDGWTSQHYTSTDTDLWKPVKLDLQVLLR